MQNKTLIVLGMHRSGTSLITQWLHSCGLEVGENLLGAGLGNAEGHFEDTLFYNIHMEILRDSNLHDSGIIINPVFDITACHIEKIKSIIAAKNQLFKEWGWKDPRTCLFLDLYRNMLPDAYYLVAIRDYQSVITSLLNRTFAESNIRYNTEKGYFSRLTWHKLRRKRQFEKFCHSRASFFLQVWILYNESILKHIQYLSAERYLVINYLMVNKKDRDVVSRINNHWRFSLRYTKFSDIYNESLLSKPFNVDQYINDNELMKKAENLTRHLNAYVTN